MSKNLTNIVISIIALALLVMLIISKCSHDDDLKKENKSAAIIEQLKKQDSATKALYQDSLNFVRGQAELQANANAAHTLRIRELEGNINDLTKRHNITKQKLKDVPDMFNSDTGYVLAPNEYVNECEECFTTLGTYKKESQQLRFERDSYDTLMRAQARIQENRIAQLEKEKQSFAQAFSEATTAAEPKWKIKASAMGMLNDLFIPNAGGAGLIYEDKKENEFGFHVLLSGRGNMYLFNVAKTISFKRKK
jgi:hypothetical protein